MNNNTLYLECRGCYFFNGDPINELSDIGNYRIGSYDHSIEAKNGKNYILEFGSYTRKEVRYNHKITGKPLKHPKTEITLYNALHCDTEFNNNNASWCDLTLEKTISDKKLTYTKNNILSVVNDISIKQYDYIILVSDYKIVSKIDNIYKTAGFRERYIIDNLIEIKTKQCDKNYHVFTFIASNGDTFDYEYNTNRITG